MLRSITLLRAAEAPRGAGGIVPFDRAVLASDDRHLRRRVIALEGGEKLLVELPEAVALGDRDIFFLEDGPHAEILKHAALRSRRSLCAAAPKRDSQTL